MWVFLGETANVQPLLNQRFPAPHAGKADGHVLQETRAAVETGFRLFASWRPGVGMKLSAQKRRSKGIQVPDVSTYPYPAGNITKRQAAELVAAVVYPADDPLDARKRIRERIRYARKIGKLSQTDSFPASDFFRWALDSCPDWAALAAVPGLPRSTKIVGMSGTCTISMSCKAYGTAVPSDPVKLREEFCRIDVERQKLAEEVAECRIRISELEAEVGEWREKDRTMRVKNSHSGKQGGRGNTF